MIVWSGHGYVVAVVTFASCFLLSYLLDAQYGEGYYSSHSWAIGGALILGGLLSSAIGFALKAWLGEARSAGSFFFVPIHWAGLVVAAIGLGVGVAGLQG